ncbi:MAG: 4-hydroxy-tetrahydrodipicolinate reductase [Tissierellia bacterium]|nr:4-hydroxy-tetrahydrodipicolinate reductase [Tissierellia bacterium]
MNVVICGLNGAMGKVLQEEIKTYENINLIGSLSPRNKNYGQNIVEKPSIVIDFSNTENLDFLLEYAVEKKCALLICTTGFNDEQKNKIKETGNLIPIMLCSNTSIGINVFRKILKTISEELKDFDIDLVERYHNKKKDALSGTTNTMAEDIVKATGRDVKTHALRAGTIAGEHTVIFSGVDETLEIKHTAFSKKIFARGAIDLAMKLYKKEAGYYLTEDFF